MAPDMKTKKKVPDQRARNRRRDGPLNQKTRWRVASYLALVSVYPIHPIRSESDLDEAIAVVDNLLGRREPLDSQEQDYLEILSHEIELAGGHRASHARCLGRRDASTSG